jgi:polysaccharide biosynthesis PFTS motif protein
MFKISNLIQRISKIKDKYFLELTKASNFLYAQKNPYEPYRFFNFLLRNFNINPGSEVFLFVSRDLKSAITSLLKQILIKSTPHFIHQSILFYHDKNKNRQFYLPKKLLQLLASQGIKINYKGSFIKFASFILSHWAQGIKTVLILIKSCKSSIHIQQSYCWINNIPQEALPKKNSETFIHWLDKSGQLSSKIKSYWVMADPGFQKDIFFEKPVFLMRQEFPALNRFTKKLLFMLKALTISIVSGVLIILGRWQLALLLKEIITYQYFCLLSKEQKALCYIFLCSQMGYRPLWTYQAEKEGIKVVNFFYASSYTLFHYNNEPVPKDIKLPAIQSASWSTVWVQSSEFKETLSALLEEPTKIDVMGPVPFVDGGVPVPEIQKNEVLVFDVDPSSNFVEYTKHGYIIPYLSDAIVCQFWEDLYALAKKFEITLLHKRKRDEALEESQYTMMLRNFKKTPAFYKQISPSISTTKLLEKRVPSVSLPFTSTGELAKLLKGKAIYYDPFSTIYNASEHARGVEVIQGINSLERWFEEVIEDSKSLNLYQRGE